jgi:hypothetical protein
MGWNGWIALPKEWAGFRYAVVGHGGVQSVRIMGTNDMKKIVHLLHKGFDKLIVSECAIFLPMDWRKNWRTSSCLEVFSDGDGIAPVVILKEIFVTRAAD